MKLERVKENPILTANPKNKWEELCVLNPAVIFNDEDQKFYMFYRAAANDKKLSDIVGVNLENLENKKVHVGSVKKIVDEFSSSVIPELMRE